MHTLNPSRLAEQRNKLKISKIEASKRIKIAQGTYVRYELGLRQPSEAIINRIAQVFGTSPEYLTDQTDDPSPTMIVLNKEDDPVLFEYVQYFPTLPESQKKRLYEYWNKAREYYI